MNVLTYVRMAVHSLRLSRLRSLLTIFGITVAIASSLLAVNLGRGLKNQSTSLSNNQDLISVYSGDVTDDRGSVNPKKLFTNPRLAQSDLDKVVALPEVASAASLSRLDFQPTTLRGNTSKDVFLFSTSEDLPQTAQLEIEYGTSFDGSNSRRTILIGSNVANKLFSNPRPLGQIIRIDGVDFIIRGVFARVNEQPLSLDPSVNDSLYVKQSDLGVLAADKLKNREIIVRPSASSQQTIAALEKLFSGRDDLSIIMRSQLAAYRQDVVSSATKMVGVAVVITLIVGGIGVMNIMLVNVAERSREIGIRKAVGASGGQIMAQFVLEAVMLSGLAGILGVSLAELVGIGLRLATDYRPEFNPALSLLAINVSIMIGILFGVGPALIAARKNPIDSLRS